MLFNLGLLLLLAPFPSLQTTANEKRNSTGSDVSKPNAGFALSKPKTTSTPAKQTPRSTVRPNTTNHTLLPTPATNQKPAAANPSGTTKSRASSAVTQATVPPTVKANAANGTITNKGKLSATVNQTLSVSSPATNQKLPTVNTTSNSKSKASPAVIQTTVPPAVKSNTASSTTTNKGKQSATVNQTPVPTPATNQKLPTVNGTYKNKASSAVVPATLPPPVKPTTTNGTITNRGKQSVHVNQTVVAKSTSAAEAKPSKDKLTSSGISNAQSSNSTKPTQDKLQPLLNQTVKSSDGKIPKDKPVTTIAQNVQSTSARSPPAGDAKNTNDKLKSVSAKTPDVKVAQDKPATTTVQNVQSTASKSATTGGAKTTNDKLQTSANQTVSARAPDVKVAQNKPATTTVQNVQSTSSKSAPAGGAKATRNKPSVSVNQTVVAKPTSTSEVKHAKDKSQTSSQVTKSTTASGSSSDKEKAGAASANHTTASNTTTTVTNATKERSAPSQPLKVVISDGCDSTNAKERELKLKPGAPLVMTHKISLVPGGCDGRCEMEMAELKGRVARLEKEMSLFRENCPCSANCPNGCSGNGECQKGKCVCHQGYVGPDCSKCAQGTDCTKKSTKSKTKETDEIMTPQKKDQKKEPEAKEPESKPRVTITNKPVTVKTPVRQEISVKKVTAKGSPVITKPGRQTVTQVLLKHDSKKQEESGKSKTVQASAKVLQKPAQTGSKKNINKIVKERSEGKPFTKSEQLKDEPQTNATRETFKKFNVTAKLVTILTKVLGTNKTRTGKDTLEQSTLAEKNDTQQPEAKQVKTIKVENTSAQTNNNRVTEAVKGKTTQKSQYIVNATTATADETPASKNKTSTHGTGISRLTGGNGLGSVKVMNISSYSFILTWLAPQGLFKNFTVIRREPRAEGDEEDHKDFEEETLGLHKAPAAKNPAEVHVQGESTDTTVVSGKITGSRDKAETKRISLVVPGNVRSVEFSNLQANTRYVLYVYGSSAERRSKIHRVTAVTGPEPATDMVFSDVTASSLTVEWSKPNTPISGYRLSYTNIVTGESHSVAVDSLQSSMVLSKLSAGSSYIISVTTTRGSVHGEALMSLITTAPAPPTYLQVVNVTDTRALIKWVPSLGKVDRFIISFESSKTPNVTVTVMLSGNTVEHQLRGLHRGTLYTVKVLSERDGLQSMATSTTFTTANVVKASEVGTRDAVITWRSSTVVYHSYRVIYQVAGEEAKEEILDSTFTEYKLTGLLPMSRYTVLVQGERDGLYTSLVTTEFITGKLRFPFPTECSQELLNGALQSGEVDIYPQGKEGQAVRVYCDMESDGGGWTVLQRRMNGKTDFYRTWSDYKIGFGNLSEEFWLGNDLLHNLTSVGPVSLRVDLQSGNDTAYAHYANFSVDSEERHYTLTVSGYTGTAGDSMRYHNGRPFSTWDKDVDPLDTHCAKDYKGGWWYRNCYKTNLNGLYGINSNNQGVVWIDWKGKDSSIPFTEMKFRPSRFSPATHG